MRQTLGNSMETEDRMDVDLEARERLSDIVARLSILEERDATRLRFIKTGLAIFGIVAGLTGALGAAVLKWALETN
jgi:hypothetical protein